MDVFKSLTPRLCSKETSQKDDKKSETKAEKPMSAPQATEDFEVTAYAALEYGAPLQEWKYKPAPLKENEVQAKILACGICASDVDLLNAKYGKEMTEMLGFSTPLVAGHEGVGVVTRVGSLVTHLKIGDRVGLGVHRGCCNNCTRCTAGDTNLCDQSELMFRAGSKGCFGNYVQINADFAFKIPDGIPTEKAGPLMCAGLTTFAPFKVHNIRPGQKIGILGIGGLGHLALMFGKAYGCSMYALTRGTSKAAEARSLGASEVIDTTDQASLNSIKGTLNYLFVTAGGPSTDLATLIQVLGKGGKMILMGFVALSVTIPMTELISNQKTVCGSSAGSRAVMKEMLEFAALHKIFPVTEQFKFSEINKAIARVKDGSVRYRAVCVADDA